MAGVKDWRRRLCRTHVARQMAVLLFALLPLLAAWCWFLPSSVIAVALLALVAIIARGIMAWRHASGQYLHWLNDACPQLQDSAELLPATELSLVAELQRQRIARKLAALPSANSIVPGIAWRRYLLLATVPALLLVGSMWLLQTRSETAALNAALALEKSAAGFQFTVQVMPPAYTGLPAFALTAQEAEIPEASEVQLCLQSEDAQLRWRWLGETTSFGTGCQTILMQGHRAYQIERQDLAAPLQQGRLMMRRDLPPRIDISQPEQEWNDVDATRDSLQLALKIEDDYRLTHITLHSTLARGSGENVRFRDQVETLAKPQQASWQHVLQRRLKTIGMEPGDELYVFVQAHDNKPQAQQTRSRTYVFRHPLASSAALAEATLPADQREKGLRSQRQLIIDTERLIAERASLSDEMFQQRSRQLASDQMVLRLRYGEFLGEESHFAENEAAETDVHHEHDGHDHGAEGGEAFSMKSAGDLISEFGHSHDISENATLFDDATKTLLRQALQAMWNAERELHVVVPEAALPFEYQALEAIKAIQQAERIYLHKTAYTPPPIDEAERFQGELLNITEPRRQYALHDDERLLRQRQWVSLLGQRELAEQQWPATETEALRAFLQVQSAEDLAALNALSLMQNDWLHCFRCRLAIRDYLLSQLPTPRARPAQSSDALARWRKQWESR
ncbi:hypothetical protein [Permianibacter aggregans]|uniref:DUF4175 domain-containing protein n=1 Tax=Permianibacter aggregans TaxID=1510150 RepID=A0A4R6UTK5_9GAMM|nr:hypothetical protein [Permianibacter aggregans]QGX38989.1 hypothetical protein E2H98_04655 [Permianibacter aggregans]TDQ46764.1 hypothetical protein EV696_11219 [Permianibacter aggregans]